MDGPGSVDDRSRGGRVDATDEPSTLELQVRLDDIERSEARDSLRWLGVATTLLLGITAAPVSPVLAGAAVLASTLVATAVGFFQVRRRQRRDSIERRLEERRANELVGATTTARRLAALHDELDRKSAVRGRGFEVLVSGFGAVLLVTIGLTEGLSIASGTGVFLGLFAAVRARGELDRLAELRRLRAEIADVERAGR